MSWVAPAKCQDRFPGLVANGINSFAEQHASVFPDLRTDDDLVLAADYSGEHRTSRCQVFTFLLASRPGVLSSWAAAPGVYFPTLEFYQFPVVPGRIWTPPDKRWMESLSEWRSPQE